MCREQGTLIVVKLSFNSGESRTDVEGELRL